MQYFESWCEIIREEENDHNAIWLGFRLRWRNTYQSRHDYRLLYPIFSQLVFYLFFHWTKWRKHHRLAGESGCWYHSNWQNHQWGI